MQKTMFNDKYRLTQDVLERRKTNTRRVIKLKDGEYVNVVALDNGSFISYIAKDGNPTANVGSIEMPNFVRVLKPKYVIGEEIAIAQSYRDVSHEVFLFATKVRGKEHRAGWGNKMFVRADLMPHRIRITNVRVERLQDISDEDCLKEGVYLDYSDRDWDEGDDPAVCYRCIGIDKEFGWPQKAFVALIDKTCGRGTWDSNPYVFVYDFELVK